MGQRASFLRPFDNNNVLINGMTEHGPIRTEAVEKVFRSVDRGFYCNPNDQNVAYRDISYDRDNVYLFSPSLYAMSLESLELAKGQKFLNIGSGIGYFSTLAGLLLGDSGINHGIEINQKLVNLAYQKLDEFKLNAAAIDHFQFCEPVFIQGNACELSQVSYYDKVYCGVEVPNTLVMFMKSLIVIGGILVMTLNGCLVKITRKDDFLYETVIVEDMEKIPFVLPNKCTHNTVKFPSAPLSLQKLCRFRIRSILRDTLPDLMPSMLKVEEFSKNDSGDKKETLPEGIFNSVGDLEIASDTKSTTLTKEYDSDDTLPKSKEHDSNHTEPLVAAMEQSAERKLEEPGGFEQNNSSEKAENPKKINTLLNCDDLPSNLSQFRVVLQEPSYPALTAKSNHGDEDDNGCTTWTGTISDNEVYIDFPNEYKGDKYDFIFEHNKNKYSQLLKSKIDSLQLPYGVKFFLNYNRTD